jgi:hypothetical protein
MYCCFWASFLAAANFLPLLRVCMVKGVGFLGAGVTCFFAGAGGLTVLLPPPVGELTQLEMLQ